MTRLASEGAAYAARANRSSALGIKQENSRLLREDIAAGRVRYRGLPEIVTLNSTDICNLRCIMCQRSERQGRHRLEDRVLRFVCDQLFPTAWKANLTTAGGEPLGAGFGLLLEQALRHGTRIDVMTNGQLLERPVSRRLLPALDHLNVSVDCAVPEVYERVRVGGELGRLVENLEVFAEERLRSDADVLLSLSAVVMRSTLPHLAELVRLAARVGADGVILQRLQHWAKRTPEEDPAACFAPEQVEDWLAAAEGAGRELGVNVFAGELGRPPVVVHPMRPKVPAVLAEGGLCSFLGQSFTVLYTGEVYPCCEPTDYRLGNVLYEDPLEIWNGEPLQRLRRAHRSRRGTLFCNGCDHAPLLSDPGPSRVDDLLKLGRRAVSHVAGGVERKLRARWQPRIYEPAPPRLEAVPFVLAPELEEPSHERIPGRREALAADPSSGGVGFVRHGSLHLQHEPERPAELLATWDPARRSAAHASCLRFLPNGDALLSFEGEGHLLRFDRASGKLERVLSLPDRRSFVRSTGVAQTREALLVGEYGLFPGARVARLWASTDGGRSFGLVHHFRRARHVHRVFADEGGERVLVTTGDLPPQRATWIGGPRGEGLRPLFRPWGGFTAIARTRDFLHFGSDLAAGNFFLRWRADLSGRPEGRRLPAELDVPWRQMEALPDGRLLALGALDEDLLDELPVNGDASAAAPRVHGCLLLSEDQGASWSVLHRSHPGSAVPEAMALLPARPGQPARLLTDGDAESLRIEL